MQQYSKNNFLFLLNFFDITFSHPQLVRYKGLYNGETANDIAKRKKLRYREDILDNMGSDELIANLFRISQTEQKLRNEKINLENEANETHYKVEKEIRFNIPVNKTTKTSLFRFN